MKKYAKVDVSEQQLEELVRHHSGLIEEGLVYIDHQKHAAGGRLDVLMVDSGKSLVVAELKVTQDDGMLLQGLDYYDHLSSHLETYARLYKLHVIDPTQPVRLVLIAPSFSQTLVNRCKWLDLQVSLYTYACVKVLGDDDVVVVFNEQEVTPPPEVVQIKHLEDHISHITDPPSRARMSALIDEIKSWPGNIALDSVKYSISLKVNGRLFGYLSPRRKHFTIATWDADGDWQETPIKSDEDLLKVKPMLRTTMEVKAKG